MANIKEIVNSNARLKVNGGSLDGLKVVLVPSGTITYNINEWTKENVTATIHIADGETIINNDEKDAYIFTQNGEFIFKYLDINNEEKEVTAKVTNIDKTAPIIKKVEGNPTEWTKDNVTLKVNAEDNLSGLAYDAYSFDGGITWQKSSEKIYTDNTNNIVIKVKDKAANETEYEPVSITMMIRLTSIRVKQEPNKKVYIEGQNFESTGMKIEATYNNGTTEEVSNYQVTNGSNLKFGQTSVTISYTEDGVTKTVEQGITVIEKLKVEVKTYEVTKENGTNYIEKIMPETSIETLKRSIETNGTVEIYKGNKKITDDNQLVGTGMEIVTKLNNEELRYTVVVTGDLTGNGKMGIGDLSKLSRHAAGLDKTLIGAYLRASDVKRDGKYGGISDISKMSRVLAGLDNL